MAVRRASGRRPQPSRDAGQGQEQALQPEDGHGVRAHGLQAGIDDHSRLAYAEIHDDERAVTAVGVLRRAVSWFAARGVSVQRVLSDNGSAYRSRLWREVCAELGVVHKRTRPYRPQTNGKIERFHRTMNVEWAFARHYRSELERRRALAGWLHTYNHHRLHSAIGYRAPISRLINVPGQYS